MARILRHNPNALSIGERAPVLAMTTVDGEGCLLWSFDDVCNVYLTLGEPDDWEIIWLRPSGADDQPPPQSSSLGVEPTPFSEGDFSQDWLSELRWHGTGEEVNRLIDFEARVNSHGIFASELDAQEFLAFCSSVDPQRTAESSVVEVFAMSTAFHEALRSPPRGMVMGESTPEELFPTALKGMTWRIVLKNLAPETKVQGFVALAQFCGIQPAKALAVIENLPKTVTVVHVGTPEMLKKKLAEGGFDFEMAAHVQ